MELRYAIKFVADMDTAVAYHRDVLGLKPGFASPFWSEFETGPTRLALHPASERNPAGSVQLGYAAGDLDGLYADRAVRGIDFVAPPVREHGTNLARFRDCEGAECSIGD